MVFSADHKTLRIRPAYNWAYPQEVVFSSDNSRIYIGMAGGTAGPELVNRFGSANAYTLRTEMDSPSSVFLGGNPPVGYTAYTGPQQRSPRQVAALHAFDTDGDLLSDQLEAYNRWNSMRIVSHGFKDALISTVENHVSNPAVPLSQGVSTVDCLDYGYYLPPSGLGYRLNLFGMPQDSINFATRGVVSTIEELGREWDRLYRAYLRTNIVDLEIPVTRPYFVVGALSQPGGGIIHDLKGEALKYTQGTGSEVCFPYLSLDSDTAHDFVTSNGPDTPLINDEESADGFDKQNTLALLRLLLKYARVSQVELDPYALELLPGVRGDPRLVARGSRHVSGIRRDLDNHMFVSFSCMSVELEVQSRHAGVQVNPGTIAKMIWPNYAETVVGIPDYANGYDLFAGHQGAGRSAAFTPMLLRFPQDIDLSQAEFKLIY